MSREISKLHEENDGEHLRNCTTYEANEPRGE